jgi:hypothetical protein
MTIIYKTEGKLVLDPKEPNKILLKWDKDAGGVSIFSGQNEIYLTTKELKAFRDNIKDLKDFGETNETF